MKIDDLLDTDWIDNVTPQARPDVWMKVVDPVLVRLQASMSGSIYYLLGALAVGGAVAVALAAHCGASHLTACSVANLFAWACLSLAHSASQAPPAFCYAPAGLDFLNASEDGLTRLQVQSLRNRLRSLAQQQGFLLKGQVLAARQQVEKPAEATPRSPATFEDYGLVVPSIAAYGRGVGIRAKGL